MEKKETKTQGRYSLIVTPFFSKIPKAIPFVWGDELDGQVNDQRLQDAKERFEGRDKLPLSLIDAFTTQFESEEALKEYLFSHVEGACNGDIVISYTSNGRPKSLDVAYSNQEEVKRLATRNFNLPSISNDSDSTERLITKLANSIDRDTLVQSFLLDEKYLDYRTSEYVCDYLKHIGSTDYRFYKKKITDNLRYKTFRGIAMGLRSYDREEYLQEVADRRQRREALDNHPVKPPSLEELKEAREVLETVQTPPVFTTLPLFELDEDPKESTHRPKDVAYFGYHSKKK